MEKVRVMILLQSAPDDTYGGLQDAWSEERNDVDIWDHLWSCGTQRGL